MRHILPLATSLCAALLLSACAGDRPPPRAMVFQPDIKLMMHYDLNHDGKVTRAELEKGLRQDFDRDDTNHDGRLDKAETRAVNERRWAQSGAVTSPLVDWNQDGYVEFDEFAAVPRSLFEQLDTNNDGVVTLAEMKPPRKGGPEGKKRPEMRERRGPGGGGEPPGGDGDGD